MSLLTTRLGIKKPQDPDPFLTTDFQTNYDLIDSYPGVFVCTSGTKPSWGSAQAGQLIFCTDTKAVLAWTGTAWADPLTLPAAWQVSTSLNVYQTSSNISTPASGTYTIGTVQSSRACNAVFASVLQMGALDNGNAYSVSYNVLVNGSATPIHGATHGQDALWLQPNTAGSYNVYGYGVAGRSISVMGFGTCPLNAGSNTVVIQASTLAVNIDNTGNADEPASVLLVGGAVRLTAADTTNT